jgi:hypothetical protein
VDTSFLNTYSPITDTAFRQQRLKAWQ